MNKQLPKREDIPVDMTWRLEDIYESDKALEQDFTDCIKLADELSAMEGEFTKSAKGMKKAFDTYEACLKKVYRIYEYSQMKQDEDLGNSANQELMLRAQAINVKISEQLSFFEPEILDLSSEIIDKYLSEEEGLCKYEVTLKEILRTKEHALSKELEKMLAASGDMAQTPHNAFGMLLNADMKFPMVVDGKGEEHALSNARFVVHEMSNDRALRKDAFEKLYEQYKAYQNTFAALYDGQVKQQLFYSRARKYPSNYVAAVDSNNVSPKVCENLIECVHKNMDKMHRYVELRKKLLGVEELHMYDVYAPMVSDYEYSVSYEEAKEISLKALAPLGEEYVSILKEAYENRWIDVCENENKRGGAYSSGVYGVHPYVLLNFTHTLDDIFTLVHEMGHSMHTWYSSHNQTFLNAEYKIFVAEVASTTNEILLLEYMLSNAKNDKERAYLTNHYLESFKGTLYRQTMFAEFEMKTNASAQEGIPLTAKNLCETYLELNKEYFGDAMVSDELIGYEWCRIPHFYYNFYVYQYATSFAAAVAIAHRILNKEEGVVEKYLEFLKSGCTKDPVSLLKIAGVDLSSAKPIDEALEVFDNAIKRMESYEI